MSPSCSHTDDDNSVHHQIHHVSAVHSHTDEDNSIHHQTHSEGPPPSHTFNDAEQRYSQTHTHHTHIPTTVTQEEIQLPPVIDNSPAAEDSDETQGPEIVTDQNVGTYNSTATVL